MTIRSYFLGFGLLASFLFAFWEVAVIWGWIHPLPGGGQIDGLNDGLQMGYVSVAYLGSQIFALVARRPAQIGWELLEFLGSMLPLVVLIVLAWSMWHVILANPFLRGTLPLFVLTEGIDIVGLLIFALQITRRSSIGFGVVDDTGKRI